MEEKTPALDEQQNTSANGNGKKTALLGGQFFTGLKLSVTFRISGCEAVALK